MGPPILPLVGGVQFNDAMGFGSQEGVQERGYFSEAFPPVRCRRFGFPRVSAVLMSPVFGIFYCPVSPYFSGTHGNARHAVRGQKPTARYLTPWVPTPLGT